MPLFANFSALVVCIYWFGRNDRRDKEAGTVGLFRFTVANATVQTETERPRSTRRSGPPRKGRP
ncbi:hypothetical protein [Azospirillum canadense]|uniref:hypothetical protein n=1 Tax=Azospirillum canadense TaxID=403962 RepID=UPI002226E452|nr:hypothetical protein [Azospirillum canadense]MCW2240909.1 hypothetical protein [Azospirillum canadense]